jgi:hypothetical protein
MDAIAFLFGATHSLGQFAVGVELDKVQLVGGAILNAATASVRVFMNVENR